MSRTGKAFDELLKALWEDHRNDRSVIDKIIDELNDLGYCEICSLLFEPEQRTIRARTRASRDVGSTDR